jgi:hypothetical protein
LTPARHVAYCHRYACASCPIDALKAFTVQHALWARSAVPEFAAHGVQAVVGPGLDGVRVPKVDRRAEALVDLGEKLGLAATVEA